MADPDGPFKLLGDEDETGCVNWIGFPGKSVPFN